MSGYHKPLALIAAVLGLTAWTADSRRGSNVLRGEGPDQISAPDLAERIMGGDAGLRVLDLRSETEFAQFHIPGARRATLDDLSGERLPRDRAIVPCPASRELDPPSSKLALSHPATSAGERKILAS